MKKTVLLLCFCMATTAVFAITKDSIIVNVGSKKKVVLYGETKEDLKNLEKIDLNKALKNMNKEMDLMSSKTRRLVVKDYDGNSYSIDSADVHQTPWQKFVKNTHTNLYLGYLDAGWKELINSNAFDFGPQSIDIYKQPHLGLSLMHGKHKMLGSRIAFTLKKGLRYDYSRFKTGGGVAGGSFVETKENLGKITTALSYSYTKNTNGDYQLVTVFADKTTSTITFLPKTNNHQRLAIEAMPTISWLDKKKRDTFILGLGLYGSRVIRQRQNFVQKNENTGQVSANGYSSTRFSNMSVGVNLTAGYRIVHFFWRADLKSNEGNDLYQVISNGNYASNNLIQGRFGLTTFGIRIGR